MIPLFFLIELTVEIVSNRSFALNDKVIRSNNWCVWKWLNENNWDSPFLLLTRGYQKIQRSLLHSCLDMVQSKHVKLHRCGTMLLISISREKFTGFNDNWTNDPEFWYWIGKKKKFIGFYKTCNSEIAIQHEFYRALTVSNYLFCFKYVNKQLWKNQYTKTNFRQ